MRAVTLIAALGILLGCSSNESTRPLVKSPPESRLPDLVLISIDTLRADRLGVYGYDKNTSPVIDGFARESVLFERHQAQSPLTLPSHASIFTGRDPDRHGVRSNGTYRLTAAADTMAEVLTSQGFTTGAFVSANVLNPMFGLDQGFATYAGDFEGRTANTQTPAAATTDRALAWLDKRRPDERLFLFVHYYDPHKPYRAPPRFEFAHPYDAEVAYVDEQLGRLFERLRRDDRLDDALIVITADHGQSLGEHGVKGHGLVLYQQTLHVPLLVRLPGGAHGGRRVAGITRSTDLLPTILQILGVQRTLPLDGIDLGPAMRGTGALGERDAYAETLFSEVRAMHQHSLVRGHWKLISWYELGPDQRLTAALEQLIAASADRPELQIRIPKLIERASRFDADTRQLYDLAADPGENRNLFTEESVVAAELEAAIVDRKSAARGASTSERCTPSKELLDKLGALGYLIVPTL